jgi:hypothetical protein
VNAETFWWVGQSLLVYVKTDVLYTQQKCLIAIKLVNMISLRGKDSAWKFFIVWIWITLSSTVWLNCNGDGNPQTQTMQMFWMVCGQQMIFHFKVIWVLLWDQGWSHILRKLCVVGSLQHWRTKIMWDKWKNLCSLCMLDSIAKKSGLHQESLCRNTIVSVWGSLVHLSTADNDPHFITNTNTGNEIC